MRLSINDTGEDTSVDVEGDLEGLTPEGVASIATLSRSLIEAIDGKHRLELMEVEGSTATLFNIAELQTAPAVCMEPSPGGRVCTLTEGHDGNHMNNVESWKHE